MKILYKIIFFFILVNNGCVLSARNSDTYIEKTKKTGASLSILNNLAVPSATISGTTTVCQNAAQPQITFTGSGGTAPYTFTYKINGGSNLTIVTTATTNSVTLNISTATVTTLNYNLISVQDASIPITTQPSSDSAIVTVKASPDATLGGTGSGSVFTGLPVFKICSNTTSTFTFSNATSTSTLNTNYSINWGDGTTDFNSTSWSTVSHTYPIGLWKLVYTIKGSNGCDTVKNYIVFVGSNPAVSLGNPGNTDICNSSSLTFPITGTTNNPPGTTYTVTFNDGSPPEVFNHPPPSSVTHTFLKSSCGITSSDGSNSYPNSFSANIVATNPCNTSSVGVVPIYVSTAPVADFTLPPSACTGTTVCMTNISTGANEINSGTCNSSAKITWTISPSTGYSINSGSLGNDFNSSDPNLWVAGSNTLCLNFSNSGTYTITIKTANRCGFDTKVKTICIEPPLVPSFTLNNYSGCSALTTTATNTTTIATNSCSPPSYVWSVTYASAYCGTNITPIPNQTTTNASFNFTEPGTYTIKLTARNACSTPQIATQVVTVKKPPTVSINPITSLCQSQPTTSITPAASTTNCGTQALTYAWSFPGGLPTTSTSAIPETISYATTGTFTVSLSVTNECGTTTATNKTFTINPSPTITGNLFSCVGFTSQLTGSTTAATTSPWTSSNPSVATISSTGLVTGISGGTTTITYTNSSNCKTTELFTVNSAPTITQPLSSTICLGGTPNVLSVTVSGATSTPMYQWYSNTDNNTSSGTVITGETNSNYTPPSTIAGKIYYYCVITLSSGGCSEIKSNTAAVTILANATITSQPLTTQNLCVGVTIPSPLSINNTGGTGNSSYQWYSNNTNNTTTGTEITGATSSTYTMPIFTAPGNYFFYAVVSLNGNGCVPATSNVAEIIIYADPIISSQPISSQNLCLGATPANLEVNATGGNGAFSYQWYSKTTNSNSGGTVIADATNSSFSPPTNVIGTKYYYCIVVQNSTLGCSVTSTTAAIIVNSTATITKQPDSSTSCLGGTPPTLSVAYSNGVGTASYQWYSNTTNTLTGGTAITTATTANFSPPNTVVGTAYYYCVITLSSGGCSNLTSSIAEVVINQNPVISSKTTLICSGNSFTVAPQNSAGDIVPNNTLFSWTTPIVSPFGVITGAVSQPTPQPTISQTLVNSSSNPATVSYTVTPISGLCKGNTFTIMVTVNPSISSTVTLTNSTCFGANNGEIQTSSTGGIPFSTGPSYTYSWTGPNGFNSSASNISNLAPGNYDLSISDAGGCPITKTYTITEPNDIIIGTDLHKNVSCFNKADGSVAITVSGGTLNYSYAWTKNGSPYSIAEDLANLAPGIYVLSVSDAKNCGPKTASFTITEPPILDVTLTSKTDLLCSGHPTGAIAINVVGGTAPYNYAWTGPNGFTSSNKDLDAIAAGTYNLVVTDNSGCSKTLSVTLSQPSEIIITATTTPIICYGDNDASIRIAVSGGLAPYQILWSNLGSSTFQDNLSAGDYLITVTDSNNCVKTLNVNIPEAPIFTINPVVKNISCFGNNNGSINLNLVGGIAPVKLVWDDNATAGNVRNNLGPGSYTVTIVDSKPCTIKRTFIILEPQLLVLSANVTNAFDCDNANSGAINLLVAGGTAPFSYAWSNGATTEDLANIPAGNYMVTVKDANGCSQQAQYSINRPPAIVIGVVTKTEFDCAAKYIKQNFVAQVSGGVPPYLFEWSSGTVSGANNEIMNTSQNGTAILYVTDAIGCKANYSFNVKLQSLGTPSYNTSSYFYSSYGNYSINDPIQFTNTATGDYISVAWDFGDGSVSAEPNPVHTFINPKDYVVTQTVTYPFGCIYVQKITFIVEKGYLLVVPNAFTPNNDNINDTLRPVTKALKNVRLDIYDTWGSLIYSETGEILRGWDGKIKGQNAENGNYFCKVSGETFYGTIVNVNHPFVLIK
ncbi:PKD domain-containing protein [uncultured Flavobacterium sp.]|uniref:PKD domain-containing protein n=1 Tax=uncultured Flavobacterium sp. TaxID=165435 RepID=UPI0030EE0C97|tara:strand:- start:81354 stop:87155 length:5802 start_codon:yes stop_codon:yes gene_type:complete